MGKYSYSWTPSAADKCVSHSATLAANGNVLAPIYFATCPLEMRSARSPFASSCAWIRPQRLSVALCTQRNRRDSIPEACTISYHRPQRRTSLTSKMRYSADIPYSRGFLYSSLWRLHAMRSQVSLGVVSPYNYGLSLGRLSFVHNFQLSLDVLAYRGHQLQEWLSITRWFLRRKSS